MFDNVNDMYMGILFFILIVLAFMFAALFFNRFNRKAEHRMVLQMNKMGRAPSTIAHEVNIIYGRNYTADRVIEILAHFKAIG